MRQGAADLVFANEAELHSLYQISDFDTALSQLRSDAKLAVVTRSEKGCVVASKDGVTAVPAFPIDKMVDTTGAGALFAAGFLFGLVRGAGHENAGRLGALAAAEVIQHIGARPQVSLRELAKANGLAGGGFYGGKNDANPTLPHYCDRQLAVASRLRTLVQESGSRPTDQLCQYCLPDRAGASVVEACSNCSRRQPARLCAFPFRAEIADAQDDR